MCGRSACTLAPDEIQKQMNASRFDGVENYKPSYNVGPQQFQVVFMLDLAHQHLPVLQTMKWGLVSISIRKASIDIKMQPLLLSTKLLPSY